MPNIFTDQVIRDTNQKTVIKLTGLFDGSSGNESNTVRIQANTLYGALDANTVPLYSSLSMSNTALPYYGLSVDRIWYQMNLGSGSANLYWSADTSKTILNISGHGTYNDNGNWITIPNNAHGTANCNGNIGISTYGANTANLNYTIIMELRKDNAYYDKGRFNDPAAFNAFTYSLKP